MQVGHGAGRVVSNELEVNGMRTQSRQLARGDKQASEE